MVVNFVVVQFIEKICGDGNNPCGEKLLVVKNLWWWKTCRGKLVVVNFWWWCSLLEKFVVVEIFLVVKNLWLWKT